jgi:hypothetical protein
MLLVRVQVDEPEYVLVQHGRVIASWFASAMWGSVARRLLERIGFRVEEIDATAMVESFGELGDEYNPEWEIPALIQEVLEEFGVEALSQPLDHDQAMHLWEKARVLDGLLLPENVHLREF